MLPDCNFRRSAGATKVALLEPSVRRRRVPETSRGSAAILAFAGNPELLACKLERSGGQLPRGSSHPALVTSDDSRGAYEPVNTNPLEFLLLLIEFEPRFTPQRPTL